MAAQLDPSYVASMRAADEAVIRTTGRRIEFISITIDVLLGLYTAIEVIFVLNSYRLNQYTPIHSRPFTSASWSPYWHVFAPVAFAIPLIPIAYVLMFYRRSGLLYVHIFIQMCVLGYFGVCLVFLAIDWGNCGDKIWCPCITNIAETAGVVTWTTCASGNRASSQFIVHFFMFLAIWLLGIVVTILSAWIASTYSSLIRERQNTNAMRDLTAYSPIASSINGEKGAFGRAEEGARLPPLTINSAKKGGGKSATKPFVA